MSPVVSKNGNHEKLWLSAVDLLEFKHHLLNSIKHSGDSGDGWFIGWIHTTGWFLVNVSVMLIPPDLVEVNLADQTVYPESFRMHNDTLNMRLGHGMARRPEGEVPLFQWFWSISDWLMTKLIYYII